MKWKDATFMWGSSEKNTDMKTRKVILLPIGNSTLRRGLETPSYFCQRR
jgi:hypothetical protein